MLSDFLQLLICRKWTKTGFEKFSQMLSALDRTRHLTELFESEKDCFVKIRLATCFVTQKTLAHVEKFSQILTFYIRAPNI